MFEAASKGNAEIVRVLAETGMKVYPDLSCEQGKEVGQDQTTVPLHAAAHNGHLDCVKVLVEANVDVDVLDDTGRTPLIAAAGSGSAGIVKYLLSRGANPTLRIDSSNKVSQEYLGEFAGADALELGAQTGNSETIKLLLDHPFYGSTRKRKFKANEEDAGVYVTPLAIKAAAGSRNFECLKLFLERGAYPTEDTDRKSKKEQLSETDLQTIQSATILAAQLGDLDSLQLLLTYQYSTNKDGSLLPFTPDSSLIGPFLDGAYNAMIFNQASKFAYLYSFDITEPSDSISLNTFPSSMKLNLPRLLETAAKAGSTDCVKLLLETHGLDPNALRRPPALSPLYVAAAADQAETVKYLLENHDMDLHQSCGRFATGPTPLFMAVGLLATSCVELLLQHGGPVESVDEELLNPPKEGMQAVITATRSRRYPVRLVTSSDFDFWNSDGGEKKEVLYAALRIELGPEDKEWLARLQIRRPDEELREGVWEDAQGREMPGRELNESEMVGDFEEGDWRAKLVDIPTIAEREAKMKEEGRL